MPNKPAEPSPEVAPAQEEMPQVPNDEIYLRAIFQTRDEAVIKALTFTRWKDGIDVEFLNAAARTIIARMTEPLRAEIARLRVVPAVAPRETQTADRSLRVIPLADKALYILTQEEDTAVRRAAVKLINIAEKHWPKEKRYGR